MTITRIGIQALALSALVASALGQHCECPLAIPRTAAEGVGAASALALLESASGEGDMLFRGRFVAEGRRGHLEGFALPHLAGATARWDAGEALRLRAGDDRRLFMAVDGRLTPLDERHSVELMQQLGTDSLAAALHVLRTLRGDDSTQTGEHATWKLAGIVHSTPVVVGAPRGFLLDPDYQDHLRNHAEREPVIYVVDGDGVLHAFRVRDAHELWAFAPRSALSRLRTPVAASHCRDCSMDFDPSVFDVRLSSGWSTILVGGNRDGAGNFFALDVSDPERPELLWERSMPSFGCGFVQPALVRTPRANELWIGSPLDDSGQASLYRLVAETGEVVEDARLVDLSSGDNMLGAATAIDLDFDGHHDLVYQTTLSGRLLRWTRSGDEESWKLATIFDTGGQPLQARPSVAYLGGNRLLLGFGSGRYLRGADVDVNAPQHFYGLIDDPAVEGRTLGPTDLRDQSQGARDTEGFQGWRFRLRNDPNERVVEPAAIVEGVVYFTSFAPQGNPGIAGGHSWIYTVELQSGAAIGDERSVSLGAGIASRPVIALAHGSVLVQGGDARLHRRPLARIPSTLKVRSWRESDGETALPVGR